MLSVNSLLYRIQDAAIMLPVSDALLPDANYRRMSIYIIAALILVISLILLRYYERIRNHRIQRVNQACGDVFSKITHEFHTPLSIILGLSKQLQEQKDFSRNNSLAYLGAIERQGKYLSELVNQLVDISNLYVTNKTMEWKTGDIVVFMEMVSESFRLYAGQKGVDLYFFCAEKVIEADFVPDYLNKILYSILYNAVGNSDDGSRIYLILKRDKKDHNKLIIKIIDHGRGFTKEMLSHLFEPSYKDPSSGGGLHYDNGIGLLIAKQLTERMGGTIHVESEKGKGSVFIVGLPARKNEKQLFPHWKPEKNTLHLMAKTQVKIEQESLLSSKTDQNDPRTTILLAEDNKDVALYIRSIFPRKQYNIVHASNGEKAWDIMNRHLPHIVITDVVMPKKSGIELCKEMKASTLLNHIPIIIISSNNSESDQLEVLKSGADCYIRKPFYPEELQAHVENLLGIRRLLKEKYHRAVLKDEKVKADEGGYPDFLRHVTDIIYREMKNADFTPVKLAGELALSISQLNKKLNAITGYPTSVYILQVKLDYAKKLLSSQEKTIGEVAAECGIYDVNYFSRVFKKYNGITPTQFKRLPPKTSPLSLCAHS